MLTILLVLSFFTTNLFSSDDNQKDDNQKYDILIKRADGYFNIKRFEDEWNKFQNDPIPVEVINKIDKKIYKGKTVPFTNFYLSASIGSIHQGRCFQQAFYFLCGLGFAATGGAIWSLVGDQYPRASLAPFAFSAASFGLIGTVEVLKRASIAHDTRTEAIRSLLNTKDPNYIKPPFASEKEYQASQKKN